MSKPRGRDLHIPFEGQPGYYNAITDVPGVNVGHITLISGEGALKVGSGPVRTGVTAICPRGESTGLVFANWFSMNGCGEMTGTTWLEESGGIFGPVMLTNTFSVGVVKDAVTTWMLQHYGIQFGMPVVTETYDGFLNDISGFHVRQEHAWQAIERATGGPVAEGCVGGGTGMICHDFKGGIGTSSRRLSGRLEGYTLGVLVQANHGDRQKLCIVGVPVGAEITELQSEGEASDTIQSSSIIGIVATDCPLLPHQLKRLAKRVSLGVGRVGGLGDPSSGDIYLAFSTAPWPDSDARGLSQVALLSDRLLAPVFEATVQATEEAIVNALVAAVTMVGRDGNTVYALPHDRLQEVMRKYNRLG